MDQLAQIVARVFDLSINEVTDQLSRENLDVWNSLNHLLLISEIEREMQVEFTSNEVVGIRTFRDLKTVVSKKK